MQLPDVAPMSIWPPYLAVQSPGGVTEMHAHHNLHLILAREGQLRVKFKGRTAEAAGIITGPDEPHAIDTSGSVVLLLFVDPESIDGASLRTSLSGNVRLVETQERAHLVEGLMTAPKREALQAWAERTLDLLLGTREVPKMHPKVRRLLRLLREEQELDTSLDALAARAGLSPSRLMHVFTESVGVPLRPYLLWLKVQTAATAIVGGTSLTRAAADAGFSDAAHMSRTFKKMFGLSPSALQRRSRIQQRGD